MISIFLAIRICTLFILLNVVRCIPLAEKEALAFNPLITSPKKDMIWRAGASHEVTWETSNIPPQLKNAKGRILLGHDGNGSSENLDVEHPLAINFPLAAGRVTVTMPKGVKPRNDYFVVLFGDSGNTSQRFKVVKY